MTNAQTTLDDVQTAAKSVLHSRYRSSKNTEYKNVSVYWYLLQITNNKSHFTSIWPKTKVVSTYPLLWDSVRTTYSITFEYAVSL